MMMPAERVLESNAVFGLNPVMSRSRKGLPLVLKLLLIYVAAITIFGKGPTYLGIEPIYWGELVLVLSLLWTRGNWNSWRFQTRSGRILTLLVLSFIVLGAIEASTDYGTWGLDTLRDSAVWYYALFYFVGFTIASNADREANFCSWWKLFFILSIPWAAEEVFLNYRLSLLTPDIGGHSAVLGSSGLEIVQSMGLGSLLLLSDRKSGRLLAAVSRFTLAALGLAAVGVYYGRGAKVAVLAAFLVSMVVSMRHRSFGRAFWWRMSLLAVLLVAGGVAASRTGRDLVEGLSLDRFQGASLDNPDETAAWRETWWEALYDSVMERNPAFGLGFGENLADYNPSINAENAGTFPVRSPHNINMTVFVRMGIVGFLIWVGIIFWGMLVPFWNLVRNSSPSEPAEVKARTFWVAVLFAIWVNSSFGVLMEGPVMGIPFWLIVGLVAGRANSGSRRRAVYSKGDPVVSAINHPRLTPARA